VVAEEGTHPNPYRYGGGWGAYYGREINSYITGKTVYDPQTQATLTPSTEAALDILFQWYRETGGSSFLDDVAIPGGTTSIGGSLDSPYASEYSLGASRRLSGEGLLTGRLTGSIRDEQLVDTSYLSFERDFGRNRGGNVNLTTPTGTNEFHGTYFFDHGRNALNAAALAEGYKGGLTYLVDELGPSHKFKGGQAGVGGPIVKDRAFFFTDARSARRSDTTVIRGGFGIFYDPSLFNVILNATSRNPFVPGDHSSSRRSSREFLGLRQAANRRFSNGFHLQTNYTFSKPIGDPDPLLDFKTFLRFEK
jgi:hypothetical protein